MLVLVHQDQRISSTFLILTVIMTLRQVKDISYFSLRRQSQFGFTAYSMLRYLKRPPLSKELYRNWPVPLTRVIP